MRALSSASVVTVAAAASLLSAPAAYANGDDDTRPSPAASAPARTSPDAVPGLAETGSEVPASALATAAASMLGAGVYLLLRRREVRSQHG